MPKTYCSICTCYLEIADIRLFGCGHGCCARCVLQLARQACPECRRPFSQDDPHGLHIEILEDADVPEPVETAVRRLERVLTGTSIEVVKAAQQSLQVLADRLGEDGKVDAGVLSAAISLLDKRVAPLLTHINNQRHTIRELMDTVDQGLPLDRELKTRELRRQLKRAEEERDRAQATLLAASGHIAAARDDAFAHPQVHAAVQEKEALETRLIDVQRQLKVALEHELARKKKNPFALSAVQRENQELKARVAALEHQLQDYPGHIDSGLSTSSAQPPTVRRAHTLKTPVADRNPFKRQRVTSNMASPVKRSRSSSQQAQRLAVDDLNSDDEHESDGVDLKTPPRLLALGTEVVSEDEEETRRMFIGAPKSSSSSKSLPTLRLTSSARKGQLLLTKGTPPRMRGRLF
ncbi:hypothetical protein BD626DRAFT_634385 [Schizophyllum amplum]|uniref:RING-type domain-containing protein n=1 Tax=Schizophyllum amplum TaxID=97359 RepID=A0A550BZQ1_9AGAR|nr:hypothetical protein BD626DRAFT_634385 [Auriculariopsis ampla]